MSELGRRERAPEWEPPPAVGETRREARERYERNRTARNEWLRCWDARCARCGQVRFHVTHEQDPATSPEGPDYYADFLDKLHPFEEPVP